MCAYIVPVVKRTRIETFFSIHWKILNILNYRSSSSLLLVINNFYRLAWCVNENKYLSILSRKNLPRQDYQKLRQFQRLLH